ncbi:MAG TPA: zf-HC2 domain-containing protein [Vicinamibacterales bacterium]|jgi:hypothetical protein|nr:zf-HC2 domain-containing protein [Vicinamibacterales bacterium]
MHPHLDPERLAAFMEGSITSRERAEIERHAADCPDCMQQLAVMARTAGAGAAPAPASALPQFMRWAVPAAIAATALAVWVNVDDARRERPAPVTAQPPATQVEEKDARATGVPSDERASASAVSPPPVLAPQAKQVPVEEVTPRRRADGAGSAKVAEAPLPSVASPAEVGGAAAASRDARASDAAAAQSTSPPNAAPVESPQARAGSIQAERRENAARAFADAGAPLEIRSPDAARRWRVRGQVLERSLDSGRTWQVQNPDLTVHALAGSAPSADVAWLVGRSGAVLRTTDGQRWARVPFPHAVDLTAILAVSPLEAVVTTADGRRFRTTDGGLSWALQESPAPPF